MTTCLTFDELLRHNEEETERWHGWFQAHPQLLEVPIDVAQATEVRGLLLHIFAVELRYGERLLSQEVTPYESLPPGSVQDLFGIGVQARAKLRQFVEKASEADWQRVLTFPTRTAGTLTASKRKCFVHALLHSMRHWAQLATALRQSGFNQDWQHDFILTNTMA